ncbi:MAG: serine/threonine-protein kinase, partial [Acidobacteriota bacterium]
FERERQILAGLDHPRIARLLDGGATESGLPYVVMEYVEGEPIDRACERLGLSVTAKVDLMLQVCDAVTAAHRALVVHRDLKPSNILIDADGRPKLLDFGIAKLLAEDSPDAAGATSAEVRRLTPAHASPEQVRGEAVTVATDVYLLGLVLYQLLAGKPPFEVVERSWLEIEKALARAPKRPSDVAPGIDADLDAIILKALRAEPRERYGSVEALSEDLRRHRRGLPVQARAGSVRYVIGKTLRRRWLPLSVAALFATLLTAFAVSTALQARELERTLGRLTAVHGFVLELIAGADPEQAKGQEVSVADLLRRGERQLELGYPDDGETRAMLHAVFGRLALHTGRLDAAQGHLQQASGDGLG